MNQILEYSPNKSSGGKSSGSDKVVRFFAVLLIIFAIAFIGVGVYGYFVKNKSTTEESTTTQTEAVISVEVDEDEATATIKVSHDKAIEKVIYNWDNDKEVTNKTDGSSEAEVEIQLPAGEHVLNVKVIDVDGVETTYQETITSENGSDIVSPVIDISVNNDTKRIEIVATDETEISYVTYKWNDEEETRIDVDEDEDPDKKTISFDIEIPKGNNDLTVVAVDASNRTTMEQQTFAGVTKPEVIITVSSDKTSIHVDCTHENGLSSVTLKMNDDEAAVDLQGETPTNINFDQGLPEDYTSVTVTVTATSVDETTTTVTEEIVADVEDEGYNEDIEISITKSEDSNQAQIVARYEEGIKEVKLNVNDVDYTIDGITDNPTDISFPLDLVEGNNKITVTIVGADDTENAVTEEISGDSE